MLNNGTDNCKKEINDPKLFCSRGFDSIANPTNNIIGETVTPFSQIASIDVNINGHSNPIVLLDISAFISSTLVRSEALDDGSGDIKLIFRIRKYSNGNFNIVSPEYIYSKRISAFINDLLTTTTSANSFEFQFCDSYNDECSDCITYVVEYYATLFATGVFAPVSRSLISLSTSISNITISALVFDSHS